MDEQNIKDIWKTEPDRYFDRECRIFSLGKSSLEHVRPGTDRSKRLAAIESELKNGRKLSWKNALTVTKKANVKTPARGKRLLYIGVTKGCWGIENSEGEVFRAKFKNPDGYFERLTPIKSVNAKPSSENTSALQIEITAIDEPQVVTPEVCVPGERSGEFKRNDIIGAMAKTMTQSIESKDMSIEDVFAGFYVVPNYQREYVWEEGEVEQLLTDIETEFRDSHPNNPAEYFIGSIVVCPQPDNLLELIDGQQRMTTLFLILCAIRDCLAQLGEPPLEALKGLIASTAVDANGDDVFRYRLELQYDDSGDVLVDVGKGGGGSLSPNGETRSIANITSAYRSTREFISREFGSTAESVKEIKRFYVYLIKQVKLIRIKTESVAHALKIFETINDRGKGLDSMDLLKNLMFMNARPEDFEPLKDQWKELVDNLFGVGEKPLRFLRYFIFSTYDVDRLREDDIYDWFTKNKPLCGYTEDPMGFVKQLLDASHAYANFLEGKTRSGTLNRYLQNMRRLSGSARQHLILLLAARHLPDDLFTTLSKHVENLFFAYIITRENTRDFEGNFAAWAKHLREVKTEDDLTKFVEQKFVPTKRDLSDRFDLAFRSMYSWSIQKYRLRYLLAKLTQRINEDAYGSVLPHVDLESFLSNQIDVEHIMPQTPSEGALREFGEISDLEDSVQRLGNLTLIEKSINTSIGNGAFSAKRPALGKSNLLLTKSIATHVVVGTNTAIDRAVANLESFESWNVDAIERRQESLRELARQVWDMPASRNEEAAG